MAAGGIAFVGGAARIGRDYFQRREGDIEFFRGDLLKGGLETLAEFGLAGERGDAAVGIDADPGIEIWRLCKAARRFRRGGRCGLVLREGLRQREADDQRATAREHAAAVENHGDVHGVLLRTGRGIRGLHQMGGPVHRAQDAHMGAAAAEMRFQFGPNLRVGRLGVFLQQRLRPHHHSGNAVAALRRLLFHEGALDRRGRIDRAQTFKRRHLLALKQKQRRDAGQHRLAVDDHGAGAALAEPAAEFGGVELDVVAEDVKQRRVGIRFDLVIVTIDLQCHHGLSRCIGSAGALCGPGSVWRNTVCVSLASWTVFSTPVQGGWLLKRERK